MHLSRLQQFARLKKKIKFNLVGLTGAIFVYTVYSVRWATYFPVNRVEHQKLNQTTPYGAVWLSFWCSTRPSAGAGN